MIQIAITPPSIIADEAAIIRIILDSGWQWVHLRHPEASLTAMRRLIESIPQSYHKQVRLHGHFALINEFNLGGLQLNSRCSFPPAGFNGSLSRSCHSIEEVNSAIGFHYVTLSPVFPSISKPGYFPQSSFNLKNLHSEAPPVVALGGVTPTNIKLLSQKGYSGFAVLGSLMLGATLSNIHGRLYEFNKIQ